MFGGSVIAITAGVREWYVRKIDLRFDKQEASAKQFEEKIEKKIDKKFKE
jgi:hypothetical protein